MNLVDKIESAYLRKGLPELRTGDTVRVFAKIKEGEKERVQAFDGVIIRYNGGGNRTTITVRKISYGVGVERIFPLHSPVIDRIELVQRGKVRRSRLYYLRKRQGKAAKITGDESYVEGAPIGEEPTDTEGDKGAGAGKTTQSAQSLAQQAALPH